MTSAGKRVTRRRSVKRAVAPANGTATWAYGIFAGRVSAGILSRLARLPEGSAPRLVPLGPALSLVVADVPRDPFETGALERRLQDIEWVGQYASAHHAVVEGLGRRGTLLPLRLFTVFDSDARATAAMSRRRRRLEALARRIGDRSEWVLRIHRPTPGPPRSAPASAASGTAFLRERADARRLRMRQARMIDAGVGALIAELAELADDSVERAVEPGTSALAEAAFLVDRASLAGFKQGLTRASADLRREGCRIALTGPWPVYSFVDLSEAGRA
jgi:hypothetical protein